MTNLEEIGQRLDTYLKSKGIGVNELGRQTETSGTQISNIIAGKKYGTDKLLIIIDTLGLNPMWLLYGIGEPEKAESEKGNLKGNLKGNPKGKDQNKKYINEPERVTIALNETEKTTIIIDELENFLHPQNLEKLQKANLFHKEIQPVIVTVDNQGRENIAFVESKVYAGYAQHYQEPEFYKNLPTFSIPNPAFRNSTFRCFEVKGESMSSTLYDGDYVIGQYKDPWPTGIKEGYIYVVVTRETIFIKRVLNRISERGKLVLISDNEAFDIFDIDAQEVQELWYVKAKLSFKFPNVRHDLSKKMSALEADIHALKTDVASLQKLVKKGS